MDVAAVFPAARADVIVIQTSEDLGATRRLWRMDSNGGGLAELSGDNTVNIAGLARWRPPVLQEASCRDDTADGKLLFFRSERAPGEVVQFRNFR